MRPEETFVDAETGQPIDERAPARLEARCASSFGLAAYLCACAGHAAETLPQGDWKLLLEELLTTLVPMYIARGIFALSLAAQRQLLGDRLHRNARRRSFCAGVAYVSPRVVVSLMSPGFLRAFVPSMLVYFLLMPAILAVFVNWLYWPFSKEKTPAAPPSSLSPPPPRS